jgi:hypothetical protein
MKDCASEPSPFAASSTIELLAIVLLQFGHTIWFPIFFPFTVEWNLLITERGAFWAQPAAD